MVDERNNTGYYICLNCGADLTLKGAMIIDDGRYDLFEEDSD